MIIQHPNFINDYELKGLVNHLEVLVRTETFDNEPFYHWIKVEDEKSTYQIDFLRSTIHRHLEYLNDFIEKRDWKINYMGFAYQTAGFPYHADAFWPKTESQRELGNPSHSKNTFTGYEGEWEPNYVPERIFTTVLYLNDVIGGETDFPTFKARVRPQTKKLLGFHCDEKHIHGVLPTIEGIRKTFIMWFE